MFYSSKYKYDQVLEKNLYQPANVDISKRNYWYYQVESVALSNKRSDFPHEILTWFEFIRRPVCNFKQLGV